MRQRTQRLALSAMLLSVMLILGYVEFVLNLSFQGIKIGLSNCVLLLCLYWLGFKQSFLLMLAKVLLQVLLFSRSFHVLMLSLAGGLVSVLGMAGAIYLLKGVSPVGAGILGGVLHNLGQVGMALLILNIPFGALMFHTAILVVVGAVMGGVTGMIATGIRHTMPPERRRQFGLMDVQGSQEQEAEKAT